MIARKLKISRTAISERVKEFRRLECTIDSSAGQAYRLISVPDKFFPAFITMGLKTTMIGRQVLLSLLFYGYATGVFSSRSLERAAYDSLTFWYITANTHPDHDISATFRKRFLSELTPLFTQILMIAHRLGVLKLGNVSLDGTKVKANASKHHALSWQYACALEKQLTGEVEELVQKNI